MLVVQRVFRAKRTNLHEKYDYPRTQIDPHHVRDIEFASGPARRDALLRLYEREAAAPLR